MGGIEFVTDSWVNLVHGNVILVYARFDGGEFLVVRENDEKVHGEAEVVLFWGEIVKLVRVVEVVGVVEIVVSGLHVVESGIEDEVVEEMLEEEMEMVAAVELAEVDSEEKHWRCLPRDPSDRMAQNISFWRPLLHCLCFSLSLLMSPLEFLL